VTIREVLDTAGGAIWEESGGVGRIFLMREGGLSTMFSHQDS